MGKIRNIRFFIFLPAGLTSMPNNAEAEEARPAQPTDNTRVTDNTAQQQSPAAAEVQNTMQNMTPQARQEMFTTQGEAKDAANKPLPELKLLDGVGQAKGTDAAQAPEANKPEGTKPETARPEAPTQPGAPRSDAPQTPEANKPEPGKTDAPTQPGAPRSDAPQAPEANKPEATKPEAAKPEAAKPEGPQKPEAPTTPAEEGPMSPKLQRGEGPYQAFKRQHPEWDHKKLMEESGKILKETGRKEFRQGEQFRNNPDGSVTIREESRKRDGTFTETTSKDGRKVEEKRGDDKGNWGSQKYDENGQVISAKTHQVSEKGTVDTSSDEKGTQTDRYNPEGKHTSSIRKNNDGSAAGWHKDKDGNTTTIEQPDANHRTEKYTDKDGKPTGSKTLERDKDGILTHNYDKDGKATGSMRNRPDGSATGWEKNPDGSITNIEQPDKANRTETTTKDGKIVGVDKITTDDKGTTTESFDKDEKRTGVDRRNKDGSSDGWKRNDDGSITKWDEKSKHNYEQHTTGPDGKTIATDKSETTADGIKQTYTDKDGTRTTTWDKAKQPTSDVMTKPDGSAKGWRINGDGSKTEIDQPDKDHRTEITRDKDGKEISKMQRETTADGEKETVTDDKGTTTTNLDKEGKKVSGKTIGKDGKESGWEIRKDGTTMSYEQPDKDHRKETISKDGNMISEKSMESNKDGRKEVTRDKEGTTTNNFDKDGKAIAGHIAKPDGSAQGWHKNPDGSETAYIQPNKDHHQEITKKDGQIINGREIKRDKDGVTTDEYNASKEKTSHQRLNNDGSAKGWTKNPDGSITNYDKPKAGKVSTRTQGPITRAA
jgi:hypothetical protein